MGDFLTYTFEHTYEVLNKLPSDQKEPDINIRLEAAHATLIALMGATNPKWEAVEWRKLGGEIPEDGSILDDFEGKNGLNKVVFPSILSTGEQSDREGHFRHFIHSAGIAFERGYAKLFGLAEYRTIPIGPQLWAQIVKPFYKDYETEAVKVADILGKAHELVSTFRKNSIPLIQTPSEGIFDPNVGGDLAVNILGARFGARVLSILQMTPFARLRYLLLLRKELNDPKFEKLSDGAILETATPKATKGFLLRILSPLEVRG
ncbi:hypothetical protein HYS91_02690 [Candidatus Daviesbacteria bacterium]|nr:hypothetical protein [Candidatus Daviesbacteria bacterium]